MHQVLNRDEIAMLRVAAQGIGRPAATLPEDVVTHLGALQAQDYPGALWSIGLRLSGATRADVERAVAERRIVRTWPMRGTLHFVPAPDVRWMLALLTPRAVASAAGRDRALELDAATYQRARTLVAQALAKTAVMTRTALYDVLERGGISPVGQRGIHILQRLATEGLICFGPPAGKQPTFVLLEEWVTTSRTVDRDEGLGILARRFFTSHGPTPLRDFAGWAGLTMADARRGLGVAASALREVRDAQGSALFLSSDQRADRAAGTGAHLLPGFDEFILGYKDRSAVLVPDEAGRVCPGNNGMFRATMILNGQVVGTWLGRAGRRSAVITPTAFRRLPARAKRSFDEAAERYGTFLELPSRIHWPETTPEPSRMHGRDG